MEYDSYDEDGPVTRYVKSFPLLKIIEIAVLLYIAVSVQSAVSDRGSFYQVPLDILKSTSNQDDQSVILRSWAVETLSILAPSDVTFPEEVKAALKNHRKGAEKQKHVISNWLETSENHKTILLNWMKNNGVEFSNVERFINSDYKDDIPKRRDFYIYLADNGLIND